MKIREYMNENTGKTILKQIKAQDKWSLASWGAKNFVETYDGIQFDVRGSKFKGRVIITLDSRSDDYSLEFGKISKSDWKPVKTIEHILWSQLIEILDNEIG